MAAAKHKASRLIVFGDCNNQQSGGKCTELTSLYPVVEKWSSFHWHVQSVDGHDVAKIRAAIRTAKQEQERPSFIELKTIKGKGIPYMENNNAWHKRVPTDEEVHIAREALEREGV